MLLFVCTLRERKTGARRDSANVSAARSEEPSKISVWVQVNEQQQQQWIGGAESERKRKVAVGVISRELVGI